MKSLHALALCAPLLTGAAGAQTIGIVTTPAGSFSNSAGQAIAKVLVEKANLRAIVQAQASTGFDEVESGSADFNVSNSFDATFYSTGTGEYEGRGKQPAMRYVGSLIPYRVAMHVRADSRINSITDLKGKRVSSEFNAQKTIARIIEAHLANMGLGYADVVKIPAPNVTRQAEDFMSGKVDVLFFALGSAAIKQANASVGEGLCRAGLAVTNALSERCVLITSRDGWEWRQEYRQGSAITDFLRAGPTQVSGTRLSFKLDASLLPQREFVTEQFVRWVEDNACVLNTEVIDQRTGARFLAPTR